MLMGKESEAIKYWQAFREKANEKSVYFEEKIEGEVQNNTFFCTKRNIGKVEAEKWSKPTHYITVMLKTTKE